MARKKTKKRVLTAAGDGAKAALKGFKIARAGGRVIVAEAAGLSGLQAEEAGWRRLTGSDRDLSAWDQTKMREIAFYLYRNNHLARRTVSIIEDFVVGDGILATSSNEVIQTAIDEFWNDPVNRMDRLNGARVREWQLWGEICLPIRESSDGRIRIGWIDPSYIDEVLADPATGLPGKIKLNEKGKEVLGGKEVLQVVKWDDKEAELVGDCFFGSINTVQGSQRGVSEFYTAADWIDALEEVLFTQIDRARLLNSFIWDVELQGMDQDAVDEWTAAYGEPPEPNSIRAHNDKVIWKAVSPQLGAYEMSRQAKDLQDYTLGGLGIPSHWYGAGDSENLATAQQMAEPTRKMLKRKQKEFIFLLTDIISYMLQRRFTAKSLPGVKEEDLSDFEVTIPDFSGPDIGKVGASISQLISSVEGAVSSEYVSMSTGRRITSIIFSELGIDIDPEDEKAKIEEEKKDEKDKADKGALDGEDERKAAVKQALDLAKKDAATAGQAAEEGAGE